MDRRLLLATRTSAETMLDTTHNDANNNDDNDSILSLTTLKVLLMVTIFLLGGLSVWAPFHLTSTKTSTKTTTIQPGMLFSWGNMMASGVLLAAGLVHQLADSTQILQHYYPSYPWAMFLCGLTFVIFMVVEESLHLMLEGKGDNDNDHNDNQALSLHTMMHGGGMFETNPSSRHPHHHHHHDDDDDADKSPTTSTKQQEDDTQTTTNHHQHHQHQQERISSPTTATTNHHPTEDQPLLTPRQALGSGAEQERPVKSTGSSFTGAMIGTQRTSSSCCGGILHTTTSFLPQDVVERMEQEESSSSSPNDPTTTSAPRHSISLPLPLPSSSTTSTSEGEHNHHHHHHHKEHIELHLHGSIVASGILLWALSIHSFLAGLSIGMEQDLQAIVGTALAILAHKAFEGFCLGSSLVNTTTTTSSSSSQKNIHTRTMVLVLGVLFASATPLGILVGQVLQGWVVLDSSNSSSSGGDGSSSVVGIAMIQAVVAGTFLYISIVEIGAKELLVCRHHPADEDHDGSPPSSHPFQSRLEFGKLICFLLGFLAMSGLAAFV